MKQHRLLVLIVAMGALSACGADGARDALATPDALEVQGADVPLDPGGDPSSLAAPCIRVSPTSIAFGGLLVGSLATQQVTISSCASLDEPATPLRLTEIGLADATNACAGAFCATLGSDVARPTPTDPLVLGPGESAQVVVEFAPTTAAALVDGVPVHESATLVVRSNALEPYWGIPITGFGIPEGDCPVAVLQVDEAAEVIPQTVLHLHGESSYSSAGAISRYEWRAEQPSLSASKLVPNAAFPSPTYEANVAGKHTFRLDVWDALGRKSCAPAEAVVYAVPAAALHVELLWESPGDPNPDDVGPMAGTDLDLHLAHPNAQQEDLDGDGLKDPWFDPSWDTFWFYPTQNWHSASSTDDDPHLDRDDVDGQGPENLNLAAPDEGLIYAIGVNYWDDHGFGSAFATVRVYLNGTLAFETDPQVLYDHDMWWVADVAWPAGTVTPKLGATGQPWITHDYHHPLFYQP